VVTVLIRPDTANLDDQGEFVIQGDVIEMTFRGSLCRTVISIGGEVHLGFDLACKTFLPRVGQILELSFNPSDSLLIFPQEID
jgi:hypothetical protein